MSADNHRFKIGQFSCIVVNDGYYSYPHPAQLFFANAAPETLEPVLRKHNLDPAKRRGRHMLVRILVCSSRLGSNAC
jgi:hypothetical protein